MYHGSELQCIRMQVLSSLAVTPWSWSGISSSVSLCTLEPQLGTKTFWTSLYFGWYILWSVEYLYIGSKRCTSTIRGRLCGLWSRGSPCYPKQTRSCHRSSSPSLAIYAGHSCGRSWLPEQSQWSNTYEFPHYSKCSRTLGHHGCNLTCEEFQFGRLSTFPY